MDVFSFMVLSDSISVYVEPSPREREEEMKKRISKHYCKHNKPCPALCQDN